MRSCNACSFNVVHLSTSSVSRMQIVFPGIEFQFRYEGFGHT